MHVVCVNGTATRGPWPRNYAVVRGRLTRRCNGRIRCRDFADYRAARVALETWQSGHEDAKEFKHR